MKHVVVEKIGDCGSDVNVTICKDKRAAETLALEMALENTSYERGEIFENLKRDGRHEEGDYGVYVVNAKES